MRFALLLASIESALIPIGALLLSLILFSIFLLLVGSNPTDVFYSIYRGGFGSWFSWKNTLEYSVPLVLTALCLALPARLGLVMIGAEGALVVGGVSAVSVGILFTDASPFIAILSMFLAGMLGGGIWVALIGWLKFYRGVNETISSLLFNYIAIALLNHLVTGPIRDPQSLNNPSSYPIDSAYMIGDIASLGVHWGLVISLVICLAYYVIFQRTTFGFAVSVIGGNLRAAKTVGLSVGKITIITCFLAGAAAGIAGTIEITAIHGKANSSLAAGYGYAGILVAFLARQNPLAIIPMSLLLGGVTASGGLLQRSHDLPDATVLILQGIIFIVILFSETMYGQLKRFHDARSKV